MISQKYYWDQKIKDWTNASYKKKTKNLIEIIAGFFRGGIAGRMKVALKTVGAKAEGKVVLDMGCGLGDFCFDILKYNPKKVIGVDISGVAIKEAQKKAKKLGIFNKIEFLQKDLGQSGDLPRFDVAVGLGFIDYLNEKELKKLFKILHGHYFFFSFFEKKLSLLNILHGFYIKIQKCPGAYKYTRKEMQRIIPSSSNFYFLEKDKMLFITNLPK